MRKNLHLLLCSFLAICLFISVWGQLHAQQSISLGDYATTTEHFKGSVGQKAPFDFDHKYSRSQQIYTAEDLNGMEGKEISEIHMRVCNSEAAVYIDDYQATLRLYLKNIEETAFTKKEGEMYYRWFTVDPAADLYATEVLNVDFIEKASEDFEIVFKLSKPFVYSGKSILMTVEAEANKPLGDVSQSFVDFYCYPKNVTNMPIRTLYKAHDKNNVAQPAGYGEFSDGSGLKQRAVLKIFYKGAGGSENPTSEDEPLDPTNPVVTVKTPGKISEQLGTISDLTKCLSLTVKGTMTEEDVKFIKERMTGLSKIDLNAATIQDNVFPKTAFSKHPKLQEVILPFTLIKIDDSALSDMPQLNRVVMGNEITEIGMNAFSLSKALSEVVWSSKLETIRSHAFSECKALKKAELPNSVTSIEQYAFQKTGLVSFKTPEKLQNLERMCFYECADLEELYITESVNELGFKTFAECKKLTKVTCMTQTPPTVHPKTFEKVNLASAVLYVAEKSLVDTYKQANFWKTFGNITVNEENPTPEDEPLDPINPVVTVKTPGKISEQLNTITDLTKCLSLTVKGTMTEEDVKFIQDRMGGLNKIDLKAATIQGNVLPKTAFSKHPKLQEVILPLTLIKIDDSALSDMPQLNRVVMGNEITEIGMNAFSLSKALSEVVWSSKLETIRSHAFSECKALKKAELPNSVTSIEQYAFQKTGLVSFKTPEKLQKLVRMSFYDCADFKELYITESVNELEFKAFAECKKLTKVTCMSETPPTVDIKTFEKINLASAVLYVAKESLIDTYKQANVWKNFGNITVTESPKKYFNLTYKNEYEGGKVKAYQGETLLPVESKVEENTTVRFVAELNEGYLLKKWRVNSEESDATGLEFSIQITAETNVEALFAEAYKRFKITFQANNAEWGKVTAQINGEEIQSESIHKADQTVVVTAHPAKNYHLRHWLVNGQPVPKQGEKNLEVVLSKQTLVEAVFERDELFYQLSASLGDNNGSLYAYVGGARIALSSKLKEGTIVEIFAEPEDHYQFDYWKINGAVSERKEPTLRITMDKNYRIEAFFKKDTAIESVPFEEVLSYQVQAGTLSINYPIDGATISLLNLKGELVACGVVKHGAVHFTIALEGVYLVRVEGTTLVQKVLVR